MKSNGVVGIQSICRVLGHKRSKRAARPLATTWSSKCIICGQRIVRIRQNRWILLNEVRLHAAALYGPTFAHAWPADRSYCFDELLQRIDARMAEVAQARQLRDASSSRTERSSRTG